MVWGKLAKSWRLAAIGPWSKRSCHLVNAIEPNSQVPPPAPLWYRRTVASKDPGSKPPLPPLLESFGESGAQGDAAVAEFGQQFAGLDLDNLDAGLDEPEPEPKPKAKPKPAAKAKPKPKPKAKPVQKPQPDLELRLDDEISLPDPDTEDRPNLEPVGDDAHPPENRRIATQPPSALADLVLELDETRPPAKKEEPAAKPEPSAQQGPAAPPTLAPRHSPTPVRRGLFSMDRPTNLLAGAAIGLLLAIFPAKKFARNYEVSDVEPLLAELEGAVEHPLGVEAGLVKDPRKIAAEIHAGRKKVRRRYVTIWLLAGLPIGLGLGFAPRPGD